MRREGRDHGKRQQEEEEALSHRATCEEEEEEMAVLCSVSSVIERNLIRSRLASLFVLCRVKYSNRTILQCHIFVEFFLIFVLVRRSKQ